MASKRQELMDLCNLTEDRLERRQIITPEMAKKLLEYNTFNRPVNKNRVRLWTEAMLDDRWDLTGDSITFSTTGVLTNGQHRLESIIKSGKSVMCIVAGDIDFSLYTDTGSKRTNLQNIRLARNANELLVHNDLVVGACNVILTRYNCVIGNVVPLHLVEGFLNYYSDELLQMYDAGLFSKCKVGGVFVAPVLAGFIIAFMSGMSIDDLVHIRTVLKDGFTDYNHDKTIVALRNKLMSMGTGGGRGVNDKKLDFTLYALNCYRQKKSVKSLRNGKIDDFEFRLSADRLK